MIRVTVELVPFGVEADRSILDQIEIANVGPYRGPDDRPWRSYRVTDREEREWPRTVHDRSESVWLLIFRALWRKLYDVKP